MDMTRREFLAKSGMLAGAAVLPGTTLMGKGKPMDGIIKEVHAKEGEKLPKGALLVTFKKPAKK